jgi:hypothetical protein
MLSMRGKLQTGAVVLLLIAAVATIALVVREYRRYRNEYKLSYTRSIKKHDIVDAARNALSALDDAELASKTMS